MLCLVKMVTLLYQATSLFYSAFKTLATECCYHEKIFVTPQPLVKYKWQMKQVVKVI